ncbi:flagellar basal body rod protein FlgB [Fictibacillus aquaticus]|uniref:Flagellar basal body rod protein FlgB n=2 Tax=Fictibacillus aquaticus TaxID=2021314 RepID=A0A235FEP6_9BACL|nr:flagellar basal body rod protein FlgB [Fictibacillus aquaticus]
MVLLFSSPIIKNLENALNGSAAKQRIINENIANADTPHYKAKSVTFASELETQLSANKSDSRHFEFTGNRNSRVITAERRGGDMNHNGNNVDMDLEMSEMAKNQLYYQTLVQRINGKFNSLKMVVKGGK